MPEDYKTTVIDDPPKWQKIYNNAVEDIPETILEEIKKIDTRYELVSFIDQGASKQVYEVIDRMTERHVAIAHPIEGANEEDVENFYREGRLHSTLEHPNIVPVYDFGYINGRPFFTMKLISGFNLRDYLSNNKNLPMEERINIFIKICEAVSYSHSAGIIHCDLKPDNIRVSQYGEVQVCDWGLAKYIEAPEENKQKAPSSRKGYATIDGLIKGTPGYMSPEQARAENSLKDERSDIYSLGAIFFELLTYEAPFHGEVDEVLFKTVTADFKSPYEINPKIPEGLEAICLKAMELEKTDRYQAVSEILADIDAFRNHYTPSAEFSDPLKEIILFYRRNKTSVIISSVALIIIFVLAAYFISSLKIKENEAQLARLKAEETAEKLIEKQNESNELTRKLIPKQAEDLLAGILKHDYLYVQDLIARILSLEPEHKDALYYKALTHIAREEYNLALPILKKINSHYADDCEKLNKSGKLLTFLHRGSFWNRNPQFQLDHAILLQVYLNRPDLSIEEKLSCLQESLKRDNPNTSVLRWTADNGLQFDLSKNSGLWDVRSLKNFPLKSLDLSDTIVNDLWQLQGAEIEELNIANSKVVDLYPLISIQKLHTLNISALENIRNSQMLRKLGIKKLTVSDVSTFNAKLSGEFLDELIVLNSKIINSQHLETLPNLKKLTVSKGHLKNKNILREKGVEVIEMD